jgi:hypothetical protein
MTEGAAMGPWDTEAADAPTPDLLKRLYDLPDSVGSIEKSYSLFFALKRKGRTYHYAIDHMGVLFGFCSRCRATKLKARKTIGPLDQLPKTAGHMVKRRCGHGCYIPSYSEIDAYADNLEAHVWTFTTNRKLAKGRGLRLPAWGGYALAVLVLIAVVYIASLEGPKEPETKKPETPSAYQKLESMIQSGEKLAPKGDGLFRKTVFIAFQTHDRLLRRNPGWILGLLKPKGRIEKLAQRMSVQHRRLLAAVRKADAAAAKGDASLPVEIKRARTLMLRLAGGEEGWTPELLWVKEQLEALEHAGEEPDAPDSE